MDTNLGLKRPLGILALMLVCSLALELKQWLDHRPDGISYAQRAIPSEPTQGVSFAAARSIAVGRYPRFVVTDDFNEDDILDLAVAGSAGIAVLLGNGDGSFGAPRSFPAGQGTSYAIGIGDFNGDGHLDLAVTSGSTVSILPGTGQGEFGAPRSFAVGSVPFSIAVADFNGDEYLDMAIGSGGTGVFSISVLLGDGRGGFPIARRIPIEQVLRGVIAGDFDNDGSPDLALARAGYIMRGPGQRPGEAAFLRGDGQGRFATTWRYLAAYPGFMSIAAADVNQDENLDLLLTSSNQGIAVFLGDGQGGFSDPRYFALAPGFVAVGDFDRDGIPDLAVTQGADHRVAVLLGDGQGNFGSPTFFSTGRTPNSIAVGDFNGDDVPDLVTTDFESGTVSVLINTTFQ